ncbi:MAG: PTS sugar transporter subunit IIA, partial [Elusimicrobiota bacterium]|nr:PTS sugar transporter subunit IIA [Elusimicrobiota bacterium]
MKILDFLVESCVLTELEGKTKKAVVTELVEVLAKKKTQMKNVDKVVEAIMKRESTGSTGIGQ